MATMVPSPGPAFCAEKQRLMEEFTLAVSEYLHAESQHMRAVASGNGLDCEPEISAAAKRKNAAKRAILRHRREHGC